MENSKVKRVMTHAVIMLHPACNMTCSFCVTENSIDSMNQEQVLRILTFLKKIGVGHVILGGGEPFLWKGNLLSLAEDAKKMGFTVQVGTNGVDLPENFEHLDCFDRFILPLESMDSDIHNNLRCYKGRHHAIILERLAYLKAAGREVTLSTVVTRKNITGLEEVADYLREYHSSGGCVHAWHLYQFIPEGRGGKKQAHCLSVSRDDYNEACQQIKEMNLGFTVFKRPDMYRSLAVGFFWYEKGRLKTGASASTLDIHNVSNGQISPCLRMDEENISGIPCPCP